jgi:hypothetical protein
MAGAVCVCVRDRDDDDLVDDHNHYAATDRLSGC